MGEAQYGHRKLLVWQQAVDLTVLVRASTKGFGISDRILRDQILRSAISVASNIAEGSGRGSAKEFVNFLRIARGSLRELDTQVEIAARCDLLALEDAEDLLARCQSISALLSRLIQSLTKKEPENLKA
ncbi:MAG TPA: four helix bundle protein [Fimbriimonadaceae bacterium]|nr:four helix bundle protein [Fimbriimonadaceae bacterium]